MPKLVLPTEFDFACLADELEALGFHKMTDKEFRKTMQHISQAPRKQEGRQVGFVFYAKGLRVCVWTTWLKYQNRPKKSAEAWVIIEDENRALYFSHPMHRTKNFVRTLLKQAWIARWRGLNRPRCKECGEFMKIAPGKGIKSRYWRCYKKKKHASNRFVALDWDYGLPPKAKKYVEGLRKRRAKYRKKRKQQGKPVDVAIKNRRPWIRK